LKSKKLFSMKKKINLKHSGLLAKVCNSRAHSIAAFVLLGILLFSCSGKRGAYSPILVLASSEGFGSYTGEILKAEGLNEFDLARTSDSTIDLKYLRNYDVVILASGNISNRSKKVLSRYVRGGGSLVAFRPPSGLGELFGFSVKGKTIEEGYIKIDTTVGPGKGLTGTTLQFHGQADLYGLVGGSAAATLYETSEETAGAPAVVISNPGKGHCAAFSYDLPKSIIYTRQGNPAWAGEERDHIDGPTATDLFYPRENEKQWNDPSRIEIPQADEQMRLLTHLLEQFTGVGKPLPRFWYFPDNLKCVFIFTIDGEGTPGKYIDAEIMDVGTKGANATLFEIGTYISADTVARWREAGHEVSVHYNDVPNYQAPDYYNMSEVYEEMTREFTAAYDLVPRTSRNHWAVWCSRDRDGKTEFSMQAIIEKEHGIQLDCNYYQFGGNNVYPNFLGDVGHFTGSGLPMRFASSEGKIIDVFQSNTQLPDETWLKPNVEAKGKTLIDRSIDEENYTWINANFHTWYWPECRQAGLNILDHCRSRGVPVFTAERVNNFIRARDEAKISELVWKNSTLSFKVHSTISNRDRLTLILPSTCGSHKLSGVNMDNSQVSFSKSEIKGVSYAMVSFESGSNHSFSVDYN
jgi:hypothetical protein